MYGLPALTARDAAANDLLHLLSAGTPREAPEVLPAPANSGFECLEGPLGQLPAQLTDDTRPVGAALRGFVQTASIVDARLRPELRTHLLAERTRLVDTVGQAREYLVDVATRLRTVGLG